MVKIGKFEFNIIVPGDYPEVNPSDGEALIFSYIKSVCPAVELTRKAAQYVTAVYGESDVARIKVSERVQWIMFPYLENNKKRYIENIDDLSEFYDDIIKSYDEALKIENY